MMLENVFKAVDENPAIEEGLKQNIKELVTVFNGIFSSIPLDNLEQRLKTLRIEKSNRLVSKRIYKYLPKENVLTFDLKQIEAGYDIKHVLMSSLLCIITAHDDTYGFDIDNRLVTLNVGYTEILSNFLVGNETEDVLFEDEIIATNVISDFVGNDVLFEAYFKNQPNLVLDALIKLDGDDAHVRSN